MTKKEIIQKSEFIENKGRKEWSQIKLKLFVKFFGKEVELIIANIPSYKSEPKMTFISETINEILHNDLKCPTNIKEEIYQDYLDAIENTCYNMIPQKSQETILEANQAYFNITTPEEAFSRLEIRAIYIDSDFADKKLFRLFYKSPWDNEHDITIEVLNRKFVYFEA